MATNIKNRRLEKLDTMGVGVVALPLSFQFNGTSAPLLVKGLQCSVARSDTGIFTVTLPGGGPQFVSLMVGQPEVGAKGGGNNAGLQFESISASSTAGTFGLLVMTAGTTTLVDVAAAATVRANMTVFVASSDVRLKNA